MENYYYKVLDWYDGANLILTEDERGNEYICMREPPGDWFLGALVNKINKKLFLTGKVDLRTLILSSDLYRFTISDYDDPIDPICMKKEELKEEYLPLDGYYYEI